MPDWLVAVILGFIEGLTEFIPVSSTGHLLIAQHWLPPKSDLFIIVIQSGAVLAVLPLFTDRLRQLARWREPDSRDLWAKIIAAFVLTAVGGFLMDRAEIGLPETVGPVAWALIVGGVLFIGLEAWIKRSKQTTEISWATAIVVGGCQLLAAYFPGLSRSGGTIMGALAMGTNRVRATEFSFLVGIPTLLAAGGLKLVKAARTGAQEDWAMLALATLVSALVSFIAVKWLLRFVQTHTFVGFGIYRIILGVALLIWAR